MIYNTTHFNEDFIKETNRQLGKPFSLIEKLKLKGIGSGRLIIAEISPKLQLFKKKFNDLNYGNIELRPKGIIVHFTNQLDRFSWGIPYYRLIIYDASFFSIHAEGSSIKFLKNKHYQENRKFIHKMINNKNKTHSGDYYDS